MLRLAQLGNQTKMILSKKEGTMCTVFEVRTALTTDILGQFASFAMTAMTTKTANSSPAHDVPNSIITRFYFRHTSGIHALVGNSNMPC
jgi:hypothetical protein